ncbi:nonsense-mediated mRNA decay protein [Purpureocillium lavendulum]|uniref:Nonsense-mediated mRNA decay protein n=1 Tax=Purpureocillium lavendulum TaxID=1247861 RepID=A0AB34FDW2_9HYPO|nr:nonsense-mediated mRNA decay protein [Purpureocillium lavendulum]
MAAFTLRRVTAQDQPCYSDCNKAFSVAQSTGKNPQLCSPSSDFRLSLASCLKCINDLVDPALKEAAIGDVYPQLQDYVDYCKQEATQTSQQAGFSSLAEQLSRVPHCTACSASTLVYTDNSDIIRTITVRVQASPSVVTSTTGDGTSAAGADLGPSGSQIPPATSGSHATSGPSRAWLAGPIIGGVVMILIVFGIGTYIYRRRRRLGSGKQDEPLTAVEAQEKGPFEKAQLHSDSFRPRELHELAGSTPPPLAEASANEIPAQELPSEASPPEEEAEKDRSSHIDDSGRAS